MTGLKAKNGGWCLTIGLGFFLLFCTVSAATSSSTVYSVDQPIVIPLSRDYLETGLGDISLPGTVENHQQPLSISEVLEESPLLSCGKSGGAEIFSFPGAPAGGSIVVWENVVLNDPSTPQGSFDFSLLKGVSFEKASLERGSNPWVTTGSMGGVISLTSPQVRSQNAQSENRGFLGHGEGDSFGGKFLSVSQEGGWDKGALRIGGSLYDTPGGVKGIAPLRKQQGKKGDALSFTGSYGSVDRTQFVFLSQIAQENFDDLYDENGTLKAGIYTIIGRLKHTSQDRKTRTNVSFSQVLHERTAYHETQKRSSYKGYSQAIKMDGSYRVSKRIQFQGGIDFLKEAAHDYGFSASRDSVSFFLGPLVTLRPGIEGEGSIRIDQGSHDTLWAAMTGVRFKRDQRRGYVKIDLAQKRPSLYYLYAKQYNFSGPNALSGNRYPVGNSSLKNESSWGISGGLGETWFGGNLLLDFDIFYRKFDRYIYAATGDPYTYVQSGKSSTMGFGPKIQVGSGKVKCKTQIEWFQILRTTQVPSIAVSPARAQATTQLVYDSQDITMRPIEATVSLITHYKPFSTQGQTKSNSLLSFGLSYGLEKNILCYVRCDNVLNKRVLDSYEPLLENDPLSMRFGLKLSL